MIKNHSGYTLIEVLVALAVFATLAAITSSAMYYAFENRKKLTERADFFNELELAFSMISNDSIQILNRAVLGNEQHQFPLLLVKKTIWNLQEQD